MQEHKIGNTALKVTRLGLGTAPLGGLYHPVSEEDALTTFELAWHSGIRFFDTAPQYGNGNSERRLGKFLANKCRDQFVVATKVGRLLRKPSEPMGEDQYYKGTPEERPVFDFSYDGVMRSVDESLTRLGLSRIDILHIHDPDDHFDDAIKGAYRALEKLRAQGTIAAVGAGMNQSEMLARFAREGQFDCFLLAGRYTLLEQKSLDQFLPLCVEKNISVIIGGVYNSGLLANPTGTAKFNYQDADQDLVDRAQKLQAVCLAHGVSLRAAALQFPFAHPAVHSVLLGPRNAVELADNLAQFAQRIPNALWADLKSAKLLDARALIPTLVP
jgi:D-threo-aldose 1-dehydrogenase